METVLDSLRRLDRVRDPLVQMFVVGAAWLFGRLEERKFDREALERWESEGGAVAEDRE